MGEHKVKLAKRMNENMIFLDKDGYQFKTLEGALHRNGEKPIANVIKDEQQQKTNTRNIESTNDNQQGGVGLLVEQESGRTEDKRENGNGQNGVGEKLNDIILNSTLKDKDKVFMIQIVSGKTKQEALNAVLQAPLKDMEKVSLLTKINQL